MPEKKSSLGPAAEGTKNNTFVDKTAVEKNKESKEIPNDENNTGEWRRTLACILICIGGFSQGITFGWFPFIWSGDSISQNISTTEQLLMASMSNLGAALGAGLSGPITRLLPVHRLLPVLSLVSALSWLLAAAGEEPEAVIAARLLTGLSITCQAALSPNYIANLAPANQKGTLLAAFSISRNLSQVMLIITGIAGNCNHVLDWKMKTYIFGVLPPLILVITFPLLPKEIDIQTKLEQTHHSAIGLLGSPSIMRKESKSKGMRNVMRGISIIPKSLSAIGKLEQLNQKKEELKTMYGSSHISVRHKKKEAIIKKTLMLMALATGYSFSGKQPLTTYPKVLIPGEVCGNSTSQIGSNSTLEPEENSTENNIPMSLYPYSYYWASFAYLVCQLVGSVISAPLTQLLGRQLVLMISSLALASANVGLSVYYYGDFCTFGSMYCYIPIAIFPVFSFGIGIGIGTLFIVVIGDILPVVGRTVSLPVVFLWYGLMDYTGNSMFPPINELTYGLPLMFLFHAIVNIAVSVLACFIDMD